MNSVQLRGKLLYSPFSSSFNLHNVWVFSKGEVINEKDRCKKCEGHKVSKETKLLEVHVDKGMKHGQKITFSGEADQAPGVEPGDIVLVLQEKEHEVTCITQVAK